ncbi:hypothetical protein E2542_SST26069 [Spatholobus suberectus]|nr:hypothetical protein E2542_SST26069 [Spatholobus suberectus]
MRWEQQRPECNWSTERTKVMKAIGFYLLLGLGLGIGLGPELGVPKNQRPLKPPTIIYGTFSNVRVLHRCISTNHRFLLSAGSIDKI